MVNNEEKKQVEVKNILYLCNEGYITNFYKNVIFCPKTNVVKKSDISTLSIESYDGFIIDFSFFEKGLKSSELVDKIISTEKPVIIVYNSCSYIKCSGFNYLSDKFQITFKELDCSIIENSYSDYSIDNHNNESSAIAMCSSKGIGRAFIKNTKYCYIMRFDNVSIIHNINNEVKNGSYETYLNLLTINQKSERPNWIEHIKFNDDDNIKKDIVELESQINNLKNKKEEKLSLLSKNEEYKKILYSSGEELVSIVKNILADMLSVPIDDTDIKKQDLYFQLDDVKILTEVKGINEAFHRGNISQVKRHVIDYANENNIYGEAINKFCKGLLIINPYRKQELKEKIGKEFYNKEVISDAKYENVCTIDTYTLLNYYSKWKKDKSINLKSIILNKTYNKPDYKDILDL